MIGSDIKLRQFSTMDLLRQRQRGKYDQMTSDFLKLALSLDRAVHAD